MTYIAYYYLKQSNRSPLEEYLETIKDKPTLAKIYRLICRLIETNCNLPYEFSRPVTGKIYELRLNTGGKQHRIFYFLPEKEKIILLNGYTKKTQKIPKHILKATLNHYKNYLTFHNEKKFIIF